MDGNTSGQTGQGESSTQTWAAQVPPWVRIPRLELILGCPLSQIDWTTISGLVTRRVTEDLTLDYKSTLYDSSDSDKKELAKDIAALANGSGGLIVLGIAEDEQSAASEVVGVSLSDGERRDMVDVFVRGIAPLIPDVIIGEVRDPSDPARGVYLLLVPPSDEAPHGIRRNDYYAWPVREDRQARWMSEPELASRYRERFAGASRQAVSSAAPHGVHNHPFARRTRVAESMTGLRNASCETGRASVPNSRRETDSFQPPPRTTP